MKFRAGSRFAKWSKDSSFVSQKQNRLEVGLGRTLKKTILTIDLSIVVTVQILCVAGKAVHLEYETGANGLLYSCHFLY